MLKTTRKEKCCSTCAKPEEALWDYTLKEENLEYSIVHMFAVL